MYNLIIFLKHFAIVNPFYYYILRFFWLFFTVYINFNIRMNKKSLFEKEAF